MAVIKIEVDEFITMSRSHLVIDVRSEGEFERAHFPGAYSIPLFNNAERAVVGTAYKQESRQTAIKIGLDYFGKKMRPIVEQVEHLLAEKKDATNSSNGKTVLIHCWRGGMRSGAVAWLLDMYGFKVYTLTGGYKTFRNWVLQQFEKDYPFKILGGFTGSGKTLVLKELNKVRNPVVDLEHLANHKGSAFGNIGLPAQPTQEMFENLLALELHVANLTRQPSETTSTLDEKSQVEDTIWLEDESQRIGQVNIPIPLWKTMRQKPLYFLDINFEERLNYIVDDYGKGEKEKLVNAIMRIQKRLGGLETKTAIDLLLENNLKESFRILLNYYDKQYLKGLDNREMPEVLVTKIECESVNAGQNVRHLLKEVNSKK